MSSRGDLARGVVDYLTGVSSVNDLIDGLKSLVRRFARSQLPTLARRIDHFHKTQDRRLLEEVIFPYISKHDDFRRVLFVGCEWYTKPYNRYFIDKEYWTLEIDPRKSKFGSKNHVVDSLRNLDHHFDHGYFDAIVCNGVFMVTAIEDWDEAEPSFEACDRCLRSRGLFILGWNDTPELRPYPPVESEALKKFDPFVFPPLATSQVVTDTNYRHVYTFFLARGSGELGVRQTQSLSAAAHASAEARQHGRKHL